MAAPSREPTLSAMVEPGTSSANGGGPVAATKPLHVLIAGGGVAAAECVMALRALAGDRVSITILSPQEDLTYRALSVRTPFQSSGGHGRSWPLAKIADDFDADL